MIGLDESTSVRFEQKLRHGWQLTIELEYGPSMFRSGGGSFVAVLSKSRNGKLTEYQGEGDTIEQAIEHAVMQAQ